MSAAVPYAGYYINLDRSADRRAALEAQLAARGLSPRYTRFAAVDGATLQGVSTPITAGELGCFLSHYRLLQQAAPDAPWIHVVEDDVLFCEHFAPSIEAVLTSGHTDPCDIVFTDTAVLEIFRHLREYKSAYDAAIKPAPGGQRVVEYRVMNMQNRNLSSTASYFVPQSARQKVIAFLEAELAAGPLSPIDIVMRKAADYGALTVGCIFPFLTTIRLDVLTQNTIALRQETVGRPDRLARALLRHAFFVDADLNGYALPYYNSLMIQWPGKRDLRHNLIIGVLDTQLANPPPADW